MGAYWLDADVLIQAKNSYYSFTLAKQMWDFIETQGKQGIVRSSIKVYGEILSYEDHADELVKWCKAQKPSGLFYPAEKEIQKAYGEIADHVVKRYPERPAKVAEFLRGADGWIIAHAKCNHGKVVTHEGRRNVTAKIPKIPNVCHDFEVGCIDLPAMLTALKFRFGK